MFKYAFKLQMNSKYLISQTEFNPQSTKPSKEKNTKTHSKIPVPKLALIDLRLL